MLASTVGNLEIKSKVLWETGTDGFSVGGDVATADAAIERDMEDILKVESAEVVEVEAGAALEGVKRQPEVEVEAGAALEGVKGQAEVEREAYKQLQMKAFPSK